MNGTPILLPAPRQVSWSGARVNAAEAGPVEVSRLPSLPAQGYRIRISPGGVRLDAADGPGEFYGRATLAQLAQADGTYPEGEVEDWPDLAVRGVMLDISRTKVPTMETLEALVDRLASWKVNHLQLYTEHTFAYPDHADVWAEASPLNGREVEALDRFCRQRHVELAANQNCLGHMERWLRHDRYRALALSPDGFVPPWGGPPRRPTTLNPSLPGSFELVRGLLHELLPHFSSPRVNVGLDEPWELPPGRAGDYVDWLGRLRALPELEGREMLVWGDILAHHPDVLTALPEGVTVCEWGYEADHPFPARAAALAAAGRPWWACPGTSSWNSILGRVTNARDNCAAAAAAAADFGAAGWLCTDWGDNGHLQYLPVSDPGLAYSAAVSWCLASNRDLDLAAALSTHCYRDPSGRLAAGLLELGELYRVPATQVPNSSILAAPLYWPHARLGGRIGAGLTPADLAAARDRLDGAVALVRGQPDEGSLAGGRRDTTAAGGRADSRLVVDELVNGATLIGIMIDDAGARLAGDGRVDSIPPETRLILHKRLRDVIDEHRRLWLARNRPGGLDESAGWLERVAAGYRDGRAERPAMAYGP